MGQILVTGATGFVGLNLCKRLVRDKADVVAFVRASSKTAKLNEIGVDCRIVDICDPESIENNFEKFSTVYHLAAIFRNEKVDQNEFGRVNVDATRNLFEISKKVGVQRFVHCSTMGVHGSIKNPPGNETCDYNPGDHYQQSKLDGEVVTHEYMKMGLPISVVRPAGIYGPEDFRFLKLFSAVNGGYFMMIGSGKTLFHAVFIDDLIEGMLLCAKREEAVGEVFTMAGSRYSTITELVNSIADVLGKPHPRLRFPYQRAYIASLICEKICRVFNVKPPIFPRRVDFFSKNHSFDISKARCLLGFEPKNDLEEGLRKTAKWYFAEGMI